MFHIFQYKKKLLKNKHITVVKFKTSVILYKHCYLVAYRFIK